MYPLLATGDVPAAQREAADWERLAQAVLAPDAYDYYAGGAGYERTVDDNERAWSTLHLRPRVLRNVSTVDTATTLLGQPVTAPIGIAPTAYQSMAHNDAELAMARAAARVGLALTVSSRASHPFEQIMDAAPGVVAWHQVYVMRNRSLTERMVRSAAAAGTTALVLTADTPMLGKRFRDVRNQFVAPESMTSSRWGDRSNAFGTGQEQDPSITPNVIGWLKHISGLPVVVKGILRGDDALMCLDAGADAIWVSNHGGRQLDGSISTAVALPDVVASVGESAEIYVDGGIREGIDVVRALALGARAVFVGRPPLWGLAVDGEVGVMHVLSLLKRELQRAMALCGCPNLQAITGDLLNR